MRTAGSRRARRDRNRAGSVIVLMAVCFTVFLSLLALALDLGWVYIEEARLVRGAEAAAAASAIGRNRGFGPDQARSVAREFALLNGVELLDSDWVLDPLANHDQLVLVRTSRRVPLFFGPVLGLADVGVGTEVYALALDGAVEIHRPPLGELRASGLVPLGVPHADMLPVLEGDADSPADLAGLIFGPGDGFQPGRRYLLKSGERFRTALDAITGGGSSNQGALHLPGPRSGARAYRDQFTYGYGGRLAVGDLLRTQPGTLEGPTRQANEFRFDRDPTATFGETIRTVKTLSARLVIVPIVSAHVAGPDDMGTGIPGLRHIVYQHGGKIQVKVIGFGKFLLDDHATADGRGVVTGRFVAYVGLPPRGQEPG